MKKEKNIKKVIFIIILTLLAASLAIAAPQHAGYVKIKLFMDNYYKAFNRYAQDPETIDLMDEYWAPEFLALQYLPLPQYPVLKLPAWKQLMVFVHSQVRETLTVQELIIDPAALAVAARLRIQFHYRASGALALTVDAVAQYQLKVDRRCKLKQTALHIFFADPVAVMELSGPPPVF